MKEDREEAYYWVMHRGQWIVGFYALDGDWDIVLYPNYIDEDELDRIGPKITQYEEP
jgi:hypothetical protein